MNGERVSDLALRTLLLFWKSIGFDPIQWESRPIRFPDFYEILQSGGIDEGDVQPILSSLIEAGFLTVAGDALSSASEYKLTTKSRKFVTGENYQRPDGLTPAEAGEWSRLRKDMPRFRKTMGLASLAEAERLYWTWELGAAAEYRNTEGMIPSIQAKRWETAQKNFEIVNRAEDVDGGAATINTQGVQDLIFETAFQAFNALSKVGEGGSGEVYRARAEDGQEYAVKLQKRTIPSVKKKRLKNELAFCRDNRHANIVHIVDYGVLNRNCIFWNH
jgi:hypothetical protein